MARRGPSADTPHYRGQESGKFEKGENNMMVIPAKNLNIIWGKDARYWKVPDNESDPAELLQVCWLEVTGCVDGTDTEKEYEVGFKLSLADDAFGWKKYPLYLMTKRGGEPAKWTKKTLSRDTVDEFKKTLNKEAGEEKKNDDKKIYFGLYEVWSGYWKGGLQIYHAYVQEK